MSREDNDRSRKVPPASDDHRVVSGKKDTKRWCKGKVGREHVKEWSKNRRYDHLATTGVKTVGWWMLACTVCGREFDYCTDWLGRGGKCKCGQHGENKNK